MFAMGGVGAGFPQWGEHGGHPPILQIFSNLLPPPIKTDVPSWGVAPLKNEARPSEKQTPPLKREALFHEMIPRKSTMNNNLKFS